MQRVTRDTLNWSVHINNVLAVITDRNPTRAGRSNVINDALYAHIIIVISSTWCQLKLSCIICAYCFIDL